jgi:hypothetical protein
VAIVAVLLLYRRTLGTGNDRPATRHCIVDRDDNGASIEDVLGRRLLPGGKGIFLDERGRPDLPA